MEFISYSTKDTIKFAEKLAKDFIGGEILALGGDLGAGKTHFTKGIAKALKIADTVTSPTFTLMQRYNGSFTLYHWDMYRISDEQELYETDFFENIADEKGVCVIEWAENIKNALPKNIIKINIDILDENKRKITVK